MTSLPSIPSPSHGVWQLGPVPIRAYALGILAGIAVAVWLGDRRWMARGGAAGVVESIAVWAVPFGIVGGRLYHVITDPELYFSAGRTPGMPSRSGRADSASGVLSCSEVWAH